MKQARGWGATTGCTFHEFRKTKESHSFHGGLISKHPEWSEHHDIRVYTKQGVIQEGVQDEEMLGI